MTAIVTAITQIIIHTPAWVWLVLALLVWRGLKSAQPRSVGLGKLLLLPAALVLVSAYSIAGSGLSSATLAGMAVGALAGVAAGLVLERRNPATALGGGQLRLAGEWAPLCVILAIFLTHYVGAVAGVMAPTFAASAPFLIAMAAISTFSSTMLVTRTVLRLRILLAIAPLAA
ncbi:hypothetical protein ABIB57_003417 [Devosia sp. UYZn731]|uniref:DUF6622 family protein n=1 Tax=Devosia sp. UYZn731 TaxID=3156345 RepID=UPI003397206D